MSKDNSQSSTSQGQNETGSSALETVLREGARKMSLKVEKKINIFSLQLLFSSVPFVSFVDSKQKPAIVSTAQPLNF